MKIESKRHSAEIIKRLRLNGVPEVVLHEFDNHAIIKFCEKYPSTKYILRDLDTPNGKYYFGSNCEECLTNAKAYTGSFSLGVSCFSYGGVVLLGEVLLTDNNVTLVARTDDKATHRNIYEQSEINFVNTSMENNKLWEVPGFDILIKYIIEHNLKNVIVEFVVFDHNVGVNNEKVLIVELRSDY